MKILKTIIYEVGNGKREDKISIDTFNLIKNLHQRADNLQNVINSLYRDFALQANKESIVWDITAAIVTKHFVIR